MKKNGNGKKNRKQKNEKKRRHCLNITSAATLTLRAGSMLLTKWFRI